MILYQCDACLKPIALGSNLSDLVNLNLVTGYIEGQPIIGKLEHMCVPCQQKVWDVLIVKEKK
jgi:hypothetical protein